MNEPVKCPVCGKQAKTGSAIDCARHMFGTGDKPPRQWVDAQGLSFIDLMIEQATTPAHHHEKSAARAVVFLVRFEVFRQLTNALAQQRDLNFWTSGIGRVRAIRVNDGLFLLSG